MYVFDVTKPITLLLMLVVTVLLIFLGKEVKKSYIPAIGLVIHLILAVMHSVQLGLVQGTAYESFYSILIGCITIDAVMYGLIDIANIENLEKAPPDIKSINPVNPFVVIASFNANISTPGTVI